MKIFIIFNIILIFNVYYECSAADEAKIANVRRGVLEAVARQPNGTYQECDVERFRTKDWLISRYLTDNENDEGHTINAILKTLRFFKQENFLELSDSSFPSEFYATGVFISDIYTKSGGNAYATVVRCLKTLNETNVEITYLFKKYIYYMLWMEQFVNETGVSMIVYLITNATTLNMDMSLLKYYIVYIRDNMPDSPHRPLVVDSNPDLVSLVSVVINFLKNSTIKNRIKFIKFPEIVDDFNLDGLPRYVGGTRENYKRIPPGVRSGICLPQYRQITPQAWKDFRERNIACITEGQNEERVANIEDYLRTNC